MYFLRKNQIFWPIPLEWHYLAKILDVILKTTELYLENHPQILHLRRKVRAEQWCEENSCKTEKLCIFYDIS